MRKAGILVAVSSLPSKTGVGDFGPACYQFIDDLKACGMRCWQFLPLNPLGYGNSPYQPYSSFAIDDLYLSLDSLKAEGLIAGFKEYNAQADRVDYAAVRAFKEPYIYEAYQNFEPDDGYREFIKNAWVHNYAVFKALKKHNDDKLWIDWPSKQKNWIKNHEFDLEPFKEDIRLEMFAQYKLYQQWMSVKAYANKQGIQCIGDIPIYVGLDSEDVWSHQDSFLLDDDGRPLFIAGVPPDYFSKTGQRWGNPIYDWDYLKAHDFKFWEKRIAYNLSLFDIVRIDHFRAFDTYWKIPADCPTAVVGEWIEAPGYELFDHLLKTLPNFHIIAEDLGDLRKEVLILRDHYHFPGMKVIEFTFDPWHEDHNAQTNMIVYPGTHDNQTLRSWYEDQNWRFKLRCRWSLRKYRHASMLDRLLEYTFCDAADTAIIAMQDILKLDDAARMNTPGTIGSPNWEWKMIDFSAFEQRIPELRDMLEKGNRL